MKKIVILTLHNANNIGAYLQAYAMMQVLKTEHPESNVVFGDFSSTHKKDNLFRKIFRYIKQGDFLKLKYKIKSNAIYREIHKELKTEILNQDYKADVFVIGSDEVWNVSSTNFIHHPEFFGHNLITSKIIAYAPSAQAISVDTFKKYAPNEDFRDITYLSARDRGTLETVKTISQRDVCQVVDPTMLVVDFDHELPICPLPTDFVLVYSYELTKKQYQKVVHFAKARHIKIVSVGTYNSWADENVIATPWLFLSYLKAAKYVVASTFHGTMLAIKYNKNFVCFSSGNGNPNRKVIEALNFYGLLDRDMIEKANIDNAFDEGINYSNVNIIVENSRSASLNYLRNALNS